jgi:peroxiredoxin (alkyl hydroperoxide reductase subunit C)
MLTIGDSFPDFSLPAVVSRDPDDAFVTITRHSYPGKWLTVFFWPKDFTFVCPTEIAEFGRLAAEFGERDCQVLGASIDSEYVHLAWRQHHSQLAELSIPMLSDIKRELSDALGILDRESGVTLRATFIVDPEGRIRFVSVNDMNVGRNPTEVLRVLDGLQTDELVPCGWRPGEATLGAAS